MPVIVCNDDANFHVQMSNSGTNLVIVDFTASWCGPCQRIAPIFERLSNQYSNGALFLKVDVDHCPEATAAHSVSAMPTFMFFRNKVRLARIQGADSNALENKIRELIGSGVTESGGESETGIAGHIDLNMFINKSESECLNESDENNLSKCLTGGSANYLESDCDEQLIINLAFNQPMKLHSIKMKAPPENGPKNIKLFINQPRTLDFDMADSMEPVQQLSLSPNDLTNGKPIQLRFVKFQNVQNLCIFIKDNQENTETTRIDHLSIIGSPVSSTNMSDFKRVAGKKGESH